MSEADPRDKVRWAIAYGLIWSGRVTLLLTTFTMLICTITYPQWKTPADQDWQWASLLPNLAVASIITFSTVAPLLVLPATSGALTRIANGRLRATTVMRRISINLSRARAKAFAMPGWTHNWWITIVSAGPMSWVILIDSELWEGRSSSFSFEPQLLDPVKMLPRIWSVLVLVLWVGCALVLFLVLAMVVLKVAI